MSNFDKLIILKCEPRDDIKSCDYDRDRQKYQIVFNKSNKPYFYSYNSVKWLDNPEIVNMDLYKFSNKSHLPFFDIKQMLKFEDSHCNYFRFFFADGTYRSYNSQDLIIEKNALAGNKTKALFEYYMQVAQKVGLKADDGSNILQNQFEKMQFVSEDSVLAKYLNATISNSCHLLTNEAVIYPFGCNLSQMQAVNNAITNQISVIEGPPGTGKTQTILNIIANIIMLGKTVAVVSNNNAAVDNVFEKLKKDGFDYIVAQLGNSGNKKDFICNGQRPYPDFSKDLTYEPDKNILSQDIRQLEDEIVKMLDKQNRIALLNQNLSSLKTEKQYFDEYFSSTYKDSDIIQKNSRISSDTLLRLWVECKDIADKNKKISFWFKLKSILFYGIKDFSLYKKPLNDIIPAFQKLFYELKLLEIQKEIESLQDILENYSFKNKMDELSKKSMILLKLTLAKKFSGRQRKIFNDSTLWKTPHQLLEEYPVVLSTTHSARNSLKGITYDYVIVDESSQVDLVTGVLAMSCARNIVVVGDLKQLPNVITDYDKKIIYAISDNAKILVNYRYEENSLLSSVCTVFDNLPRTLLREHYRCHPKIIDFCNKKFYNSQLIIMSEDKGEEDVLKVYITSEGNHARGHFNQRQIDEIKKVILPELSSSDVGIIAPYNAQTSALINELQSDIDISTVHKFQGREKDEIIISTVDNEITEFTDNPNMLNVAVSRAKNRLRLVVSDNEKNDNTNIGDLIKYIQYNNFEVVKSDVYSVFDMLYKGYFESRRAYLSKHKKVSEFDSENLMYSIIDEVLSSDEFSQLSVVVHQPLNAIIRDPHRLSDEECAYAMNIATHLDFLIFNTIDKMPILAVEVDGYYFHKKGTCQNKRDIMKNNILEKYGIPLVRFNTTGSMEKERLVEKIRLLTRAI